MLASITQTNVGLVHLMVSLVALIMGSVVLFSKKGTASHKRNGYIYSVSMALLLITAFTIYNLYGKFGIFHWLAVVSSVTLLGGIMPMWMKWPKNYVSYHFSFMYWSVFGLYGAFAAELLVRIPVQVVENGTPNPMFYNLVGIAVFIIMGIGYFFFNKQKSTWLGFDKTQQNS